MKTSNGSRNAFLKVALVTFEVVVAGLLTWFAYRCGADNTSVLLTVGSGIALGWFSAGNSDVNSGCNLFVFWFIALLAGSAMAFGSGGIAPAVALFVGGVVALFATCSIVNS